MITFGIGPAGTGKSWLAVAMAVQALQAKQVQRIILTRPAVEAGERLGFLPGDLMAKIDPYLRPLYDALYDMVDPEGAQKLLERGTVEVAPLAFMRGRTLNNSFIILDEAQNTTPEQMKMFLTRIGFGSKVVVTGDVTQVDVPDGRSGLVGLEKVLTGIDSWPSSISAPADVVRHQIVADIVAAYERDDRAEDRHAWLIRRVPPASASPIVVCADEQNDVDVDAARWAALAEAVLRAEGAIGELTLTFVDRAEMASLNAEYMGVEGPTDVLSFPLDAADSIQAGASTPTTSAPTGRHPCCSVTSWCARRSRRSRRPTTAAPSTTSWRCWWCTASCTCSATITPNRTRRQRCVARERDLLAEHHWHGPAPTAARSDTPSDDVRQEQPTVTAVVWTTIDSVMLLAIVLLLFVLMFFAVAETSLNRISRVKAQAIADSSGKPSARALYRLVSHPERFINPILVTITFCQTGQAFLTSLLADRLFGGLGVVDRLLPQRHRLLRAGRGDAEDVGGALGRAGRAGDGTVHRVARVVPAAAPHLAGLDRAHQHPAARARVSSRARS